MEPFETTCVLWRPQDPDAAVGGTLRFDRDIGLSADLIGSLDPDEPIASIFEPPTQDELADLADLTDLTAVTEHEVASRDPRSTHPGSVRRRTRATDHVAQRPAH